MEEARISARLAKDVVGGRSTGSLVLLPQALPARGGWEREDDVEDGSAENDALFFASCSVCDRTSYSSISRITDEGREPSRR